MWWRAIDDGPLQRCRQSGFDDRELELDLASGITRRRSFGLRVRRKLYHSSLRKLYHFETKVKPETRAKFRSINRKFSLGRDFRASARDETARGPFTGWFHAACSCSLVLNAREGDSGA